MFKNNKFKFVLLAVLLFFISALTILLTGNKYILKTNVNKNINSINDLDIILENNKNNIKINNSSLENGVLKLEIESLKKGKVGIIIGSKDVYEYHVLYIHRFGIITYNSYLGDMNNLIVIPISIFIFIFAIYINLIKKYKTSYKVNMYNYKNVVYLGIIIFLSISLITQLFGMFKYNSLINIILETRNAVNMFSFILLPIAFITSILVTISNILLLKKEGFTWKNMLGIILGLFFCFLTIFPEIMNRILFNSTIIDVHNQNQIGYLIQDFIETLIYIIVSYLECILLGTIILSVKAAKHIPEFNKDYIIILGCMIKKDGTLTNLLKSRVDRAIEFRNLQKEKTGKDLIFVPSGGKGNDEIISEAEAMKNYLLGCNIKEKNILIENKSKNTLENIKNSYEIIKEKNKSANIAFSTTNFHVFRAGNIASNLNIKAEGIGAKTKTYFWINAFIREYIATLVAEKKKHILIIMILVIITVFILAIYHLSNTL